MKKTISKKEVTKTKKSNQKSRTKERVYHIADFTYIGKDGNEWRNGKIIKRLK